MIQTAAVLVLVSFVLATLSLLGLISQLRWKPAAPIDWGNHEAAVYRREAILRDEITQGIRTTKTSDQRRITRVTTQVIQQIPEQISGLPQPEQKR